VLSFDASREGVPLAVVSTEVRFRVVGDSPLRVPTKEGTPEKDCDVLGDVNGDRRLPVPGEFAFAESAIAAAAAAAANCAVVFPGSGLGMISTDRRTGDSSDCLPLGVLLLLPKPEPTPLSILVRTRGMELCAEADELPSFLFAGELRFVASLCDPCGVPPKPTLRENEFDSSLGIELTASLGSNSFEPSPSAVSRNTRNFEAAVRS
tara:strand:+ start:1369 stop:1989 length:621 start_codon:yes stop_codon:yes gene_type:complete